MSPKEEYGSGGKGQLPTGKSTTGDALEIVSKCPRCGAPIYGHKHIRSGGTPKIKRSCICRSDATA
jgi:hypothetical protein